MFRVIKYLVLSIAALIVGYVLFVAGMRFRAPTESQRAALETLRQPVPAVAGRDASDAIWLLGHEVPAEQQASVAGELRRYYDQRSALTSSGRDDEASTLVNPLSRFVERPSVDSNETGLCEDSAPGCLELVRAKPDAVKAALRKHDSGLKAALALSAFDGFRIGLTPNIDMEIPRFNRERRTVRTYFASEFVDGRKADALAGLCDDLAAWRRLGANTDSLIGNAVGAAYARNDLLLLGEMLAELPVEEALPSTCAAALQPTQAAELSLCDAMRGEFRFMEATIPQGIKGNDGPWADRLMMRIAVDRDRIPFTIAPAYARHCDPSLSKLAIQDKSWSTAPAPAPACTKLSFAADPIACILSEMGIGGDSSVYVDRRTDLAAIMALTRTILWLRDQATAPKDWPAKMRERPESLGLRREPVISDDGREISIPLLDQRRDKTFSIPLPASRLPPAADAR